MKRILLTFAAAALGYGAIAQVQLDKPLQLTGSGADAKVSGIKNVSASQDAVSAEVAQSNSLNYAAATGAANAYAVTLAPGITSLTTGQIVTFRANLANTGAATLNVNGLGAAAIRKNGDAALAANDIKANQIVTVVYDGTAFQMTSQVGNASGGGGGDPTLIYTTDGF